MYGVMNGVDDPRLVGKSSGFSSLPASRSDETARGAYASRVIAPTKRRRDGYESRRTLGKCHRRVFRLRFGRQVARERSLSRIERRNIQLVQLSLRVFTWSGEAYAITSKACLPWAIRRFSSCWMHLASVSCTARLRRSFRRLILPFSTNT